MKRHLVKSCCGSTAYVLELDRPVTKQDLIQFKQAGYATTEAYTRVGVFFVEKKGLTATGPIGGTKIQVKVSGKANASKLLDGLQNIFKVIDETTPKKT
jgi:hypothetical protein